MTFAATVLTLYPEMFPGPLGFSLAGRALERGDWSLETVQIRDFAADRHRTVDDTPAGGGAAIQIRRIQNYDDTYTPAMIVTAGNHSNSAKLLGISRPTLYDLLKQYDLQP